MRFTVLLVVLVIVTAVGCTAVAGEGTTPGDQETTTGGAVTSSTPPPLKTRQETPEATTQQGDGGYDTDKAILVCQVDEAAKDNGVGPGNGTKQGEFIDEVYQEAQERDVEPEQVLSERGYDCGWSALQQSRGNG